MSRSRRGDRTREDELTTDSRLERETDEGEDAPAGATRADGRRTWRRVAARAVTVAAFLLVLAALVTPDEYARLTPGAFARIPVEGVLGVALILVVPERARRWVAVTAGAVLGVLFVLKVLDIGFDAVLVRPFDLVLDWPMLAPGVEFVKESAGQVGAIGAVVLVAVLTVGVIVLMALVPAAEPGGRAAPQARGLGRRCPRDGLARVRRPRGAVRGGRSGGVQECRGPRLRPHPAGAGQPERQGGVREGRRRRQVPHHARRQAADGAAGEGRPAGVRGELRAVGGREPRVRAARRPRPRPGDAAARQGGVLRAQRLAHLVDGGGGAGWRTPRCCPGCGSTTSSGTGRSSTATG